MEINTTTFDSVLVIYTGADPGGLLGADEPPQRQRNFFASNSCREWAEFGHFVEKI